MQAQNKKEVIFNKQGPIVVIEDDADDQEMLMEIFTKLNYPNKVLYFENGVDALHFMESSDDLPFLILSDINLPKLDGFALREKLKTDAKLSNKCIPYLFFLNSRKSAGGNQCVQSIRTGIF